MDKEGRFRTPKSVCASEIQSSYCSCMAESPSVLIVPSNELVPRRSPYSSIFQLHQGNALAAHGWRVGFISVDLDLPMSDLARSIRRREWRAVRDGLSRIVPSVVVGRGTIPLVRARSMSVRFGTRPQRTERWLGRGEAAVQKYIQRHGLPDIIHAHNLVPAGLFAARVAKQLGIPFVVTEHSSAWARRGDVYQMIEEAKVAAASASARLAVSQSLADELASAGLGQWEVVPNVLSPDFARAPAPALPTTIPRTLLNVGSLIPGKGHRELLRAFAVVRNAGVAGRLVIIGEGPLRRELERQAQQLSIAEDVQFRGAIDHPGLIAAFEDVCWLVHPSHYETFGVVLVEAFAMGRGVVAVDSGAQREIVERGHGMVLPAGDDRRLEDALEYVLTEEPEWDPSALRARTLEWCGPEVIAGVLSARYEDAIRGYVQGDGHQLD